VIELLATDETSVEDEKFIDLDLLKYSDCQTQNMASVLKIIQAELDSCLFVEKFEFY